MVLVNQDTESSCLSQKNPAATCRRPDLTTAPDLLEQHPKFPVESNEDEQCRLLHSGVAPNPEPPSGQRKTVQSVNSLEPEDTTLSGKGLPLNKTQHDGTKSEERLWAHKPHIKIKTKHGKDDSIKTIDAQEAMPDEGPSVYEDNNDHGDDSVTANDATFDQDFMISEAGSHFESEPGPIRHEEIDSLDLSLF